MPQNNPKLLALAGAGATGAFKIGATIPLLQNTQANMNADIQPLVDAIMAHGQGREDMKNLRADLKSVVKESRSLLMLGRDSMKTEFGNFFNPSWMKFGHTTSIEVSEATEEVSYLLLGYKAFLAANPAYELPTKNFTAVKLAALSLQIKAAMDAIKEQDTVIGNLMDDRDAKAAILRKRVRGLAHELGQKLGPLDQRWKTFGFNMPGAVQSPEGVGAITAVLIGPNAVALKWNASARAEFYHVFKRVVGVDAEFVLVGSPADVDFTLENLPAAASVEIVVTAVNNGGESAYSEKATLVTH